MLKSVLDFFRGMQRPTLGVGIPAVWSVLVVYQVIALGQPVPDAFTQFAVGIGFFAAGIRSGERPNTQ